MSKTGVYMKDKRTGRWVKISDKPGTYPDAFVPEGGYWDETLGEFKDGRWQPRFIETKSQKAALLRKRNLVEDGGWRRPIKRVYVDLGSRRR